MGLLKREEPTVTDKKILLILKICITIGILLILLGIYLHNFSEMIEAMGVKGIVISAMCIALGMILSLPTKMYLTFILVKQESDKKKQKGADQQ
ncbi:MAG: polyferredoxin [Paraglaciecola sp.]|jgi:polyferredoxin